MVGLQRYAFGIVLLAGLCGSLRAQDKAPNADGAMTYDEVITVVSSRALNYPPIAVSAGVQGIVVVAVTLDAEGGVTTASALSGNRLLVPSSLQNVREWKFKPNALRHAVVVYKFELVGICEDRPGSALEGTFRLQYGNLASITTCGFPAQFN